MTELQNWVGVVVPQRHFSGCIPTGYEWLIRYLRIRGVNLQTFQEDCDLRQNNSFGSVADKIRSIYPTINIQIQHFTRGIEKIERVKSLIEKQVPCLISLALGGINGWHIMPVVSIDDATIEMIHHADASGNHTWRFANVTIVWRHDNLQGGNDISWINSRHDIE